MTVILRSIVCLTCCWAAQAFTFEPPQRHAIDRYEADWERNPFTLKTAPVALQKDSIAKDLALGGIDNLGAGHRIVVVNTKTRERFPVREGEVSPSGMKIKSVHRSATLKDTYVEMEAAGEVVRLAYDEAYLKQVSSAGKPAGSVDKKTASTAPPTSATQERTTPLRTEPSRGPAEGNARTLALHDTATPSSGQGRSESPASRQRRRVQTVPNTP